MDGQVERELAVNGMVDVASDLRRALREAVGRVALHDIEDEVRQIMVSEAMNRADGSRRKAAKLLCVSRQLLQNILRADS